MKGDFTRFTFDANKHYRNVLTQQGRVTVDADPNEQQFITSYRIETEAVDVIGPCGAPMHDAGFGIVAHGAGLSLTKGRYYVDGILCENDNRSTPISVQPDLPANGVVVLPNGKTTVIDDVNNVTAGVYLAFLDVWLKHVTALEDDSIREKALGGPDTATRLKTAWQVKLIRVANPGATFTCPDESALFDTIKDGTTGKMRARAEASPADDKPCVVSPSAGFRRLENQLYRVEVHNSGALGKATFKWSRDNGSVVTSWTGVSPNPANPAKHRDLTVASIGRDKVLRFAGGQWVELFDDTREETASPGIFVQVVKAEGEVVTVDFTTAFPTGDINLVDFPKNPKVRRWDFHDKPALMKIVQPAAPNDWLKLEDGLEVKFEEGNYRSGDYWLIPARTVEPYIEWPGSAANPTPVRPHGIEHHYCKLAVLSLTTSAELRQWSLISDCRNLFPPVTELTSLFYLSGDGQEAMPHTRDTLKPLRVGVANGKHPVEKVPVRFRIIGGSGTLIDGNVTPNGNIVLTDTKGVAECRWTLDSTNQIQQVEATLDNGSHLPIRFNANLSRASAVSYTPTSLCPDLAGLKTVQEAIDKLCQSSGRDPGIHVREVFVGGQPLRNDTEVLVTLLARGIRVVCDTDVFQDSVRNKPVCLVTLDMPFPINSLDRKIWGDPVIGFQPLILLAQVNADGKSIYWTPTEPTRDWLNNRLFKAMLSEGRGNRVMVHLTVKGNFIWAAEDNPKEPNLYLDGEAFGLRLPGAANTDVRFDGDGRRGGDLEMWFQLIPPKQTPALFKVNRVQILAVGDNPNTPVPRVLATLESPANAPQIQFGTGANAIDVQFTTPPDRASITKQSFIVSNRQGQALNELDLFLIDKTTLRWVAKETLPQDIYNVVLSGSPPAITSNGVELDGEPTGFPSGNNIPGGDFTFKFVID